MKIKELIQQLQSIPPNYVVTQSSDAEGNSYHEVDFVLQTDSNKTAIIYPKHKEVNI